MLDDYQREYIQKNKAYEHHKSYEIGDGESYWKNSNLGGFYYFTSFLVKGSKNRIFELNKFLGKNIKFYNQRRVLCKFEEKRGIILKKGFLYLYF